MHRSATERDTPLLSKDAVEPIKQRKVQEKKRRQQDANQDPNDKQPLHYHFGCRLLIAFCVVLLPPEQPSWDGNLAILKVLIDVVRHVCKVAAADLGTLVESAQVLLIAHGYVHCLNVFPLGLQVLLQFVFVIQLSFFQNRGPILQVRHLPLLLTRVEAERIEMVVREDFSAVHAERDLTVFAS